MEKIGVPVTDAEGTNLIMEQLAVDGTTLYGVTEKIGVYRLGKRLLETGRLRDTGWRNFSCR